MDLLLKTVAQFPLVALFVYIWWTSKAEAEKEMNRLRERIAEKDDQLSKMIDTFDRFNTSLALIKDRLR